MERGLKLIYVYITFAVIAKFIQNPNSLHFLYILLYLSYYLISILTLYLRFLSLFSVSFFNSLTLSLSYNFLNILPFIVSLFPLSKSSHFIAFSIFHPYPYIILQTILLSYILLHNDLDTVVLDKYEMDTIHSIFVKHTIPIILIQSIFIHFLHIHINKKCPMSHKCNNEETSYVKEITVNFTKHLIKKAR